MSYLPAGTPLPQPTPDDQAYWDFIRQRQLRIQRCTYCARFRHPPMPNCPSCRSASAEWAAVSGNGEVFSYTIVRHAAHPALKTALPFNVAVVMLDDAGDVRLVSNVVDASHEEMRIGLSVSLVWEATEDGGWLPRFCKRADATQ
ncbi:Zn-ribbon domain-containing OB-fold protein [Mesorhizobium sp. 1B3]|uniref:Zn-ribbon domain-containing OB-fold protein n=1 Tax=Mesorhizobium sp. 1B3 TaxID=3243599 RepID=UPI003D96FC36